MLARRAKSLITPIVITNGERFSIANARCRTSVDVGDPLLELQPATGEAKARRDEAASQEVAERVTIAHDHGIHARPAALIANFAKTVGGGDRDRRARPQARTRRAQSRSCRWAHSAATS